MPSHRAPKLLAIVMNFWRTLSEIAVWEGLPDDAARPDAGQNARSVEERVNLYFVEFGETIFKYLVFACRHREDAEELTQETFLRLYRALVADPDMQIENVRHWLFRAAKNLAIDRYKRNKRRAPFEQELSEEIHDTATDQQPTPQQALVDGDRTAAVLRATSELTPKQRRCFQLRSQGFTLREIAEMMDMDVRRVAEAVQRAVQNIQRRTSGV
jgi:RNA polymerase sigma factor (sigma-70 family)